MAKKISSKDIFEGKPLQPLIDDAKKTVIELKKLEQGLKQIASVAKNDLKGLKLNSFTNVSKASKAVNDVDKSFKGLNETTKERVKLQGQLKRANSDSIQKNEELRLQLAAQKKTNKELAKEKLGLISVYDKESKRLNTLRKKLKELILTEGEGAKGTKKLAAEVGKLDAKLKKADAAAGQFQRNVGNYPKGLKGAIGSLKNFAGALGITAGVAGLVRVMGNAVKIAKDFEQGNANLAAVLGKTKDQIGDLTTDAKRLGAATAFSATQVSGLQVEFAKLGFTEKQILAATEATLSLAAATGSDLGEAAAIAGATLGGFGLKADQTQRVVDVMAKSFSTSALDIEKFKESMKTAAPAAAAVGVSVEETTALLGTLANSGISGSKAGNNLAKSFIELNRAGLSMDEAFSLVNKSSNKLGTAVDLVGVNAAKAFLVLAKGTDATKELTKGLNNAGGAAEKMAKEQLDTLQGSLTILNSAWEGFVLGLLSGDSAFSSISRSIVETTTSLLGMLTPAEELADTWFSQRDAVDQLESGLNPLLDRYDELKKQTKLTKDEQEELDTIIQQVAKTVPTAITEFDKYGKALDINTDAAKKFIQQQKDLLALDNAKAIEEQEDAIVDLNDSLEGLNNTYIMRNGILQTYSKELGRFLPANAQEISDFTKKGEAIRNEIILREAKIARLKGEKTELQKLAESQENETELIEGNTDAKKENLRTDKEIAEFRKQAAKDAEALRKAEQKDLDEAEDRDEDRLAAAAERQQNQLLQIETHNRGLIAEHDRLFAELEKQAADEIDLAKKTADAKAKADQELREKSLSEAKKYHGLTADALSDAFDEEEKQQDDAIKRREESLSLQQERAANGLSNTLAFEKEQLAQQELERKNLAEKRAKAEEAEALALAFLNAFAARSKDDPDTAAAKALGDVIVAKAISETVAGAFAEGVEDFQGEGTGTSDSNLIRFSHGESVVTAKGTKDNKGLTTAMNNGDVGGWFANNMMLTPLSSDKSYDSFGLLAEKIDSIEKAIKNRPTTSTNLDNMGNVLQSTYKNGVRNTVKYMNTRPRI